MSQKSRQKSISLNSEIRTFSSQPRTSLEQSLNRNLTNNLPHSSDNTRKTGSYDSGQTSATKNSIGNNSTNNKNGQGKCEKGFCYAILLPHIYSEDFVMRKQPFLVKISENQLLEFGFKLPFDDIFDPRMNNFIFNVQGQMLSAQIIATSDNSVDLKKNLRINVDCNETWKNHERVVGNSRLVLSLEHQPLEIGESPVKHVFSDKKFKEVIQHFKESTRNEIQETEMIQRKNNSADKEEVENPTESGNQVRNNKISSDDGASKLPEKDQDAIKQRLEILNEKKIWLSDNDPLAYMVKNTLEVVNFLFSTLTKDQRDDKLLFQIPIRDPTYKIRKRNQIFIEGELPLPLDKYQIAMIRSKSKNPYSFGYQIIHIAFPQSFFKNVTLGKKFYDESEIEKYKEQYKESTEKIPLVFVLGFNDPLNEPFKGNFDYIRGQTRIRALIDHSFRKAGYSQYDEKQENMLRNRIGKEMSSKNKNQQKRSDSTRVEEDEQEVDQTEIEDNSFESIKNDSISPFDMMEDDDENSLWEKNFE